MHFIRKVEFLFFALAISCFSASAQYVYKIKGDSVHIYNDSCNAELILENSTRNITGFLYNKGRGRTEFRRALIKINDSIYLIGADTLNLKSSGRYIQNQTSSVQTGGFNTSTGQLQKLTITDSPAIRLQANYPTVEANGATVLKFGDSRIYLKRPVWIDDKFILKLGQEYSDPGGYQALNGAIYYNYTKNKFRGYQNGFYGDFLVTNFAGNYLMNTTDDLQYNTLQVGGKSRFGNGATNYLQDAVSARFGGGIGIQVTPANEPGLDIYSPSSNNHVKIIEGGLQYFGNIWGPILYFNKSTANWYAEGSNLIHLNVESGLFYNSAFYFKLKQTNYVGSPNGINIDMERATTANTIPQNGSLTGGRFKIRNTSEPAYGLYLDISNQPTFTGKTWAIYADSGDVFIREKLTTQGAQEVKRTVINSAITLNDTHYYLASNATNGSFAITLPQASTCSGRVYIIKKIDSSTNNISITPYGTDTVDGTAGVLLSTQWQKVTIISTGSGWEII